MEFEIDVQHGLNGHVEITDYSKEYGQYYPEDAEGMNSPDKFKYSQSNSINVLLRTNTDRVTLIDVLLDQHDQDKETTIFNTTGAVKTIVDLNTDFAFFQEVDVEATRSYKYNQYKKAIDIIINN